MSPDLAGWLAELVHQQKSRDSRVSEAELYRSFDRFFDNLNAARAQGETMSTDPAGEPYVVPLSSGEAVTISTVNDAVLVALYAPPSGDTGTADDTVLPAQAMRLTPSEAEMVSGLIGYAAVSAYGARRRLLAVTDDEEPDDRRS